MPIDLSHTCFAGAGSAALAASRRGSLAGLAALGSAAPAAGSAASGVPWGAVGVFGLAVEAGLQGPEVAPPAAGSAAPVEP